MQQSMTDTKFVMLEGNSCLMKEYKFELLFHSDSVSLRLKPGDWMQYTDEKTGNVRTGYLHEIWFRVSKSTEDFIPNPKRFYLAIQDYETINIHYTRLDIIMNTITVIGKILSNIPPDSLDADTIMNGVTLSSSQIYQILSEECLVSIIIPFIGLMLTFPLDLLSEICLQEQVNTKEKVLTLTTQLHSIMDPIIESINCNSNPKFSCNGFPIYDPFDFLLYQYFSIMRDVGLLAN